MRAGELLRSFCERTNQSYEHVTRQLRAREAADRARAASVVLRGDDASDADREPSRQSSRGTVAAIITALKQQIIDEVTAKIREALPAMLARMETRVISTLRAELAECLREGGVHG